VRFLADESCDFAVVRALRDVAHDAAAVVDNRSGVDDEEVAEIARRESRILLTEDKDFGRIFFASVGPTTGVFPIRFPARARRSLPSSVVRLVSQRGDSLRGRFVAIQPGRVRIRPPA
jgi:predicted nuclease of predicted toxin-antitoxin system